MAPVSGTESRLFSDLKDPEFFKVHHGQLVFIHSSGVAVLEASPEALKAAGLDQLPVSQHSTKEFQVMAELQKRTQFWLLQVQASAHSASLSVIRTPTPLPAPPPPPPPPPVEEKPERQQTVFIAKDLFKEFDSKRHAGKHLTVSGQITRIFDNKNGTFKFVIEDCVIFTSQASGSKVKSMDTSGNPREISTHKLGDFFTGSGMCIAKDSEGFILLGP